MKAPSLVQALNACSQDQDTVNSKLKTSLAIHSPVPFPPIEIEEWRNGLTAGPLEDREAEDMPDELQAEDMPDELEAEDKQGLEAIAIEIAMDLPTKFQQQSSSTIILACCLGCCIGSFFGQFLFLFYRYNAI